MRYRFALPTLTLSMLTLALAGDVMAQQKKPAATTAAAGRPAAPAASPAAPAPRPVVQTVAPSAATPAPAAPTTPAPEPKPAPAARKAAPQQPSDPHVGITAGLAAPMSSLGKAFTAGFTAGGFAQGKPATLPVSLRGDLQYTRFPGKTTGIDTAYTALQLTGAAIYDFPNSTGGKSPFFASGGLGLYRWSLNGTGQTDFGQNLGLGYKIRGVRFQPLIESRFHFFNDVQYFTLTAGAHFR
ncbi:MAG: hypothetical protein U5K74_05125 [Gemmatimonadaceae bacterium]|nr:hypothetical protein [Gemmatimonadaceae bacterium]